jgi:hypothetical protein
VEQSGNSALLRHLDQAEQSGNSALLGHLMADQVK